MLRNLIVTKPNFYLRGVIGLKKWGNALIVILVSLYIIDQLTAIPYITEINTVITMLVIVFAITYSRKLPKLFSSIMVIFGTIVLLIQGVNKDILIESVTKNLPLVCLIIIVPVLSIPIRLGKYNERIANFFSRYYKQPHILYMMTYSFFYLLGPITNLGSIHIIHSMVDKMKFPINFLGRIYTRGFSSINTWAPYFASVFLVVYYLEIPMYIFLPFGLLLSLFQFATASTLFTVHERKHVQLQKIEATGEDSKKKLLELLFALLLLISIIFIIEPFIPFNVSVLIILVAGVFAFIWSFYLKESRGFVTEVNEFRNGFMDKQANEVGLFLTAGFFGVVLANSPISKYIHFLWSEIANLSIILLILFTIILICVFSFIGVHQIVIVSSILASVSPAMLGIHEITFAMILLSAWAIASVLSPIAPMNVISSSLLNVNVFHMIFRWNIAYILLIIVIHTFVIYAVHLFVLS